MIKRIITLVVFTIVLNATAEEEPNHYSTIVIQGVPHILQEPDFCGEAAAAMALQKLGENMDQDYIFDRSGLPPEAARGLHATELASTLEDIGFDVGPVWTPLEGAADLEKEWARLHGDLLSNIPSIVLMHTSKTISDEHFRLVLGYDGTSDSVIYHEPAEQDGAYRLMDRQLFLDLWSLQDEYQWGTVRIRMAPKELEYGNASEELTDADYARHLMSLRERVPTEFKVKIEKPFVIVSDCDREEIEEYSDRVIRQVVELFKKDFFLKDPDQIIDIWMLRDHASYEFHASAIFGIEAGTPFGFYSPAHNSLILDISTGGGTLVHELFHPFMRTNFENAPPWLNEGMASLFERPTRRNGHIYGLVNWRIEGLKEAISRGETLSFVELTNQGERQFYKDKSGVNYAQAKYLMYYLQERGQLVDFYHAFYENRRWDPSGLATLKELLGVDDLRAFQSTWEKWVLDLDEKDA